MAGWKINFPFEFGPILRCELLVLGRVRVLCQCHVSPPQEINQGLDKGMMVVYRAALQGYEYDSHEFFGAELLVMVG